MLSRTLALALVIGAVVGPGSSPDDGGYASQDDSPEHGGFGVVCEFSHRAKDDPIVHPGHEGMAHSHEFIGNKKTAADSTYDDMVGNPSTCDRKGDDAAYWFPTLYNDGRAVEPGVTLIYYRTGGLADKERIKPIPADLKVIAGDAMSERPQDMRIVTWACAGPGPEEDLDHIPASCGDDNLRLHFYFPNCWDGENLDSRDHKSHLAYAWQGDGDRKQCPGSHPVQLPTLEISTRWRIDGRLDDVTLASGPGHTAHADFWNTWVQSEMRRLTEECLVQQRDCVKD